MADSDPFGPAMSLKEIAHALAVSARTVRRWVKERKFPPPRHLPGGKPTWFAEDVRVFRYLVGRGMYEAGEIELPPDEDED